MQLKNLQQGIAFCFLFGSVCCAKDNFDVVWAEAQVLYRGWIRLDMSTDDLISPVWHRFRAPIAQALVGPPNRGILRTSSIESSMLRLGRTRTQDFEERYLTKCLTSEVRARMTRCTEAFLGPIPQESSIFKCSTNTLGHLFYLGRVLSHFPLGVLSDNGGCLVCEFGAGFGSLARLTKQALSNATFVLIDIPELLAVQYIYLKMTLPNCMIKAHTQIPDAFEEGCIHLFPVALLQDLNLKPDLFISTFALTEAPRCVQEMLMRKRFMDATYCYITGQLDDWGKDFHMNAEMIAMLRAQYSIHSMNLFHIFADAGHSSYEFIGAASA